jgi:very-short-patch-repair endonuclease
MTQLESPMEWKFARALNDYSECFVERPPCSMADLVAGRSRPPGPYFTYAPQVTIGKHRVDFGFVADCFDLNDPVKLAVEIDGHEFHEKTKWQAARDKRRDRDLVCEGVFVMRFTGSEIHQGASDCVQQVLDFMFVQHAGLIDRMWERVRHEVVA